MVSVGSLALIFFEIVFIVLLFLLLTPHQVITVIVVLAGDHLIFTLSQRLLGRSSLCTLIDFGIVVDNVDRRLDCILVQTLLNVSLVECLGGCVEG